MGGGATGVMFAGGVGVAVGWAAGGAAGVCPSDCTLSSPSSLAPAVPVSVGVGVGDDGAAGVIFRVGDGVAGDGRGMTGKGDSVVEGEGSIVGEGRYGPPSAGVEFMFAGSVGNVGISVSSKRPGIIGVPQR